MGRHTFSQSRNLLKILEGNILSAANIGGARAPVPPPVPTALEGKEEEEAKQQLLVNRVHNRRVSRPWHRTNSAGASGQRLLLW